MWKTTRRPSGADIDERLIALDAEVESRIADQERILRSLDRSQAVIEFEPDGTIIRANQNFSAVMGYSADEIVGRHHRMFVEPAEAGSDVYVRFWDELADGVFHLGEFKRVAKGGREVWLQATYNPVLDDDGRTIKVVKYASDMTAQREREREIQRRSQAVIEFLPDGTILEANDLFCRTVGYDHDEIIGRHHRIFMPPGDAEQPEYEAFWASLRAGEMSPGVFRRVDSSGRDVWIRGAYTPVVGMSGEVIRIVKGVVDVTEQIEAEHQSGELGQSIATSVGEMSQAIDQIAKTVATTATLAGQAEGGAANASDRVGRLDAASQAIGHVIGLIQGLAEQTNLLALNATIEAARAGEAGTGFAVVAGEVKTLATQTSEAAGDIRSSIETIQNEITNVVGTIQEIADSVTEVSQEANTVAAAVEEQSVVMARMNESAQELLTLNRR